MGAQEDFTAAVAFARDFLGLDEKEGKDFVDKSMEKRGHKRVTSWADSDGEKKDDGGGGFFGSSSGDGKGKSAGWQYQA